MGEVSEITSDKAPNQSKMKIEQQPAQSKKPNKTDAGNGSQRICRVGDVHPSPSPDPSRSAKR